MVGEFLWLLMRILKFSGNSIRMEINALMITYLSLCTASTGRSTSLNQQPQVLVISAQQQSCGKIINCKRLRM